MLGKYTSVGQRSAPSTQTPAKQTGRFAVAIYTELNLSISEVCNSGPYGMCVCVCVIVMVFKDNDGNEAFAHKVVLHCSLQGIKAHRECERESVCVCVCVYTCLLIGFILNCRCNSPQRLYCPNCPDCVGREAQD